ncbi:subtilisin-like protease [Pyrus ussuriensis x Pyrus communis]|uniref:Subtilisin-like protease n=1 Tax=Pyrus ussuriensis x Pyrus communis TaxID=2448454 RepID=A0A5N5GK48_9ROSA|nr:subtilisin-like protease [Pyrus ussuriensis x Pyrus communis]
MPDQPCQLYTTYTPSFLGLAESFVDVLDTRIWTEHPSFSDSGLGSIPPRWKGTCIITPDFPFSFCNRKIIEARAYFNGYKSHIRRLIDESNESKSLRNTEGHGTHTASTAAATKARITVYKICWSFGCFDSNISAAMNQAIANDVDIISLSVRANGRSPLYDRDSIAIRSFEDAQHSVLVFASTGNFVPNSFMAINIAPWILTVSVSTIDREFLVDVILGDNRVFGEVSLYSDEPLVNHQLPLIYNGDAGSRYSRIKRVVTNVGNNTDSVFKVIVTAPAGVEISISPSGLVYNAENQSQSCEVTFSKGVGYDGRERYGFIEWTDGSHLVRSPVAVRWSSTRDEMKSPKLEWKAMAGYEELESIFEVLEVFEGGAPSVPSTPPVGGRLLHRSLKGVRAITVGFKFVVSARFRFQRLIRVPFIVL